jgi:hypothetical protein
LVSLAAPRRVRALVQVSAREQALQRRAVPVPVPV